MTEDTELTSQLQLGFPEQPWSTKRETPEGLLSCLKEEGIFLSGPWSGRFWKHSSY